MNDDYKFCKKCGSRLEHFKCPICDYHPDNGYSNVVYNNRNNGRYVSTTRTTNNPAAAVIVMITVFIIAFVAVQFIVMFSEFQEEFDDTFNQFTNPTYVNEVVRPNEQFEFNGLLFDVDSTYERVTINDVPMIKIPIVILNNSSHVIYNRGADIFGAKFNGIYIIPYTTYEDNDFMSEIEMGPYNVETVFVHIPDYGDGMYEFEFVQGDKTIRVNYQI